MFSRAQPTSDAASTFGYAPIRGRYRPATILVVFQTPPLDNDMEVTGRLIVKLWATSNSLDTDFTAKLIDVYPPNIDFPGGRGSEYRRQHRAGRYRNGLGKAELLKPGQAVRVHHRDVSDVARLPAGHTASDSIFRAATFRVSTSIRIPESRSTTIAAGKLRRIPCTSTQNILRTSCCP